MDILPIAVCLYVHVASIDKDSYFNSVIIIILTMFRSSKLMEHPHIEILYSS